MESIQKRLVAIRKHFGLSQTAFANRLGLTHTAISFMETSKTKITEQNIKTICYEFGVSVDWFKKGVGDMFPETSLITPEIIAKFERLSHTLQAKVISYIDGLMDAQNSLKLELHIAENMGEIEDLKQAENGMITASQGPSDEEKVNTYQETKETPQKVEKDVFSQSNPKANLTGKKLA